MIKKDQPTCFNANRVQVVVSSVSDGQMQYGWKESDQEVLTNRKKFLTSNTINPEDMVLLGVKYHKDAQYDIIKNVDEAARGKGLHNNQAEPADCLITTTPQVAMFLPIADCVGTVVYDPVNNVLALAHLGRHSSIAKLAKKLVLHLQNKYGTEQSKLIVWMAPSIQFPYYVLENADFVNKDSDWQGFYEKLPNGYALDLQNYNKQLFLNQGVLPENVNMSVVNTAISSEYWSHFTEITINAKDVPARFAVVAMLR